MIKEQLPNSFIYVADGAFSKELCKRVITTFEKDKDNQRPGHTMTGHHPDIKLTLDAGVDPALPQWASIDKELYGQLFTVLKEITMKYSTLNAMPLVDTGYNIQRYAKNAGRYIYHMDEGGGPSGGDRYLSVVIYLNDVTEGGETEFKYFGIKVKPKTGRVLIFPPYWMYLHRGCKPISNDKYIISTFVRIRPEEE